MFIPSEPRLDVPFLSVLVCAFWLAGTSMWYYKKAERLEKELNVLKKGHLSQSIKPVSSMPTVKIDNTQPRNEDKL